MYDWKSSELWEQRDTQQTGRIGGKERYPRKDQELAWLQMPHSNTSKQDNGGIHSEFWEKITCDLDSTPNSIMIYNHLEKSRSSHIQTFKIQKMCSYAPILRSHWRVVSTKIRTYTKDEEYMRTSKSIIQSKTKIFPRMIR